MVDQSMIEFLSSLFDGITEGGKIIIGLILILGAILFFFGRSLSKKLADVVDASIEAAAEARKAKVEAEAAKVGINNNHETNVRDDIDGNHRDLSATLSVVLDAVNGVRDDIGGIRSEMRDVRRIAAEDRREVATLRGRVDRHIEQKVD